MPLNPPFVLYYFFEVIIGGIEKLIFIRLNYPFGEGKIKVLSYNRLFIV